MSSSPYREAQQPEVPDHFGDRMPGAVFWTPPPPQIGSLLSAWSNQNAEGYVRPPKQLRALIFVFALLLGMGALFTVGAYTSFGPLWGVVVGLVCAGFVAIVFFDSRPFPHCTYLASEGFSEHRARGKKRHSLVRFADVAALYSSVVDNYTNGAYQGTDRAFEWRDANNQRLGRWSVRTYDKGMAAAGYRFGSGGGKNRDTYMLRWQNQAQEAWVLKRTPEVEAELKETGSIRFPTLLGGSLKIREGAIEYDARGKGQAIEIRSDEIADLRLKEGILTVVPSGKKKKLTIAVTTIGDWPLALHHLEMTARMALPV